LSLNVKGKMPCGECTGLDSDTRKKRASGTISWSRENILKKDRLRASLVGADWWEAEVFGSSALSSGIATVGGVYAIAESAGR